jgi:hypothetical protein
MGGELQGLTLANHRIDKAVSIEKSHARKKLRVQLSGVALLLPNRNRGSKTYVYKSMRNGHKKGRAKKA